MVQILERTGHCPKCRTQVLVRERQFNSQGHAALCVVTCFLWLPFFLLAVILHTLGAAVFGGYLCTRCGNRVRKVW